ncbi:putative F-box/LRR-repeat protein 23 [Lactuca sativa]|uniref:F-box domain-containing protein n=1 Tax=Lactuca sativa TaxID=4236 RepID=A0A9R1WNP4_LACSA|nr:putative F-box/LRR-repeat protein 23 [Lactuca sativa]XP_023762574.1 putative F-box/LRR-repeat protein 23 [Lactuca sativa]KAJ0225836.1 hypothetical protein LSAT_V11C100004210 [Lactuca sativa]
MKLKFVLNSKQQWELKQQTRNWLELPYDVMANILYRVGVCDILLNAQKVCTTWRNICKDTAMWRVINMYNVFYHKNGRPLMQKMCKHAVNRSQGQLVDITIEDFANPQLLRYISDRASQLRRLEFVYCYGETYESWAGSLRKFPLLEELSIYLTDISTGVIVAAGRFCPMLTTLKINDEMVAPCGNVIAVAIGKNLPKLKHLELIGSFMTNTGLQAILDGCCHLELLDLRQCVYIDPKDDLVKKCLEKIKCVKLPYDSLEGCRYVFLDEPIAGPAIV